MLIEEKIWFMSQEKLYFCSDGGKGQNDRCQWSDSGFAKRSDNNRKIGCLRVGTLIYGLNCAILVLNSVYRSS